MAEGIEVRFFGKLTYYAISIYVLFVLGLLIVCTRRYKARLRERRLPSRKGKSNPEAQSEKDEMGLMHARPKDERGDDEAVRQRRGMADKVARCGDGTRGYSVQNSKTANGQMFENNRTTFRDSLTDSRTVDSTTRPLIHETISQGREHTANLANDDRRSISKPESVIVDATSAKDDNKNTIAGVVYAEFEDISYKSESTEMGRTGTANYSNDEAVVCVATSKNQKDGEISSDDDDDIRAGVVNGFTNRKHEVRKSCFNTNSSHVEMTDRVCQASTKNDPLSNYENQSCPSIVDNVRHVETTRGHIQRRGEEDDTVSSEVGKGISDEFWEENNISQSVKDKIIDFADQLANEIIYGYDEDSVSALTPSGGQPHDLEIEKTMEKVSLGLCQAIANDVCRDAPKAARDLEVFCEQIARLTLDSAFEEYSNLPADQKQRKSNAHKRSLLTVDGQRRKIFRSSENICHDDLDETGPKDVLSFSSDIGSNILDHAIKDVKSQYGLGVEKNIATDGSQEENMNGPDIVINDFQDSARSSLDSRLQARIDSMSNLDADDEDDDGEESYYSDESDRETDHHPVVLRNKSTLKLKLHSDRPLSGYAEQLAQFLADDDDGLDMFESDEEFDAVLDKLEEKYRDNEGVYTKIQKRRRLSESRRKSESSMDTSRGAGKRILSLDRLSDEDWREGLTSTMSESSLLSCTDTDDALKGAFSDDQLMSPDPGKFDFKKTVVVDTGCGLLKAGLAGEIAPSEIIPSVIGVPRRFSQDVSKMTRGYYVGDAAITHAGMLQLDHPIKKAVTNWSDVYSMLEYILEDALQVNVREHPVLLTEIGLLPKNHREKLTEIMFERFGCQAFFLANQGPLSLYSMGLTSGLCLNSGYLTTQTIPVYEGHSLPYCTRQLDIGGQQITNYLGRQLLSERSLAFSSSSEKFLLSDMMERYCYVAQDLKNERIRLKKQYEDVRKYYELPDGQLIDLDVERFQSPEILYDPEILGLEQKPLHQMVLDSIAVVDQDIKMTMMNNIIVTGGTTLLQGFTQRLNSELASVQDHTGQIKLTNAHNPVTATWTGASVISSLSTFSQQCITTDQYADIGSHVVHMKCF